MQSSFYREMKHYICARTFFHQELDIRLVREPFSKEKNRSHLCESLFPKKKTFPLVQEPIFA